MGSFSTKLTDAGCWQALKRPLSLSLSLSQSFFLSEVFWLSIVIVLSYHNHRQVICYDGDNIVMLLCSVPVYKMEASRNS